MKNMKIRVKLMEHALRYYELDRILGISEPTRCRMLRDELPDGEQDRICKLIDEYVQNGGVQNGEH